jgi:hypothetical protein
LTGAMLPSNTRVPYGHAGVKQSGGVLISSGSSWSPECFAPTQKTVDVHGNGRGMAGALHHLEALCQKPGPLPCRGQGMASGFPILGGRKPRHAPTKAAGTDSRRCVGWVRGGMRVDQRCPSESPETQRPPGSAGVGFRGFRKVMEQKGFIRPSTQPAKSWFFPPHDSPCEGSGTFARFKRGTRISGASQRQGGE